MIFKRKSTRSLMRRNRRRPSTLPQSGFTFERLENRRMLSLIVWTNRAEFDTEYGANTATARAVIDQAILDWSTVIESFNYRNIGQKGAWAPHNYYEISVAVKDWQSEPDNQITLATVAFQRPMLMESPTLGL